MKIKKKKHARGTITGMPWKIKGSTHAHGTTMGMLPGIRGELNEWVSINPPD